jgi:hypothetical protein
VQKWVPAVVVVLLLVGGTVAYVSWQTILLRQQNETERQETEQLQEQLQSLQQQLLNQSNQLSGEISNLTSEVNMYQSLISNLTAEVGQDQGLTSNLTAEVGQDQSLISNLTSEVNMYQSLLSLNTTSSNSTNGLFLGMSLNTTTLSPGQGVDITVAELNLLDQFNNISVADAWALKGLATGGCPSLYYPFGIAVLQGIYTSANLSQAVPLRIFPVVACPMIVMYITGYLFQPMSDNATVLPGTGEVTMATAVSASGTYSTTGNKLNQLTPFTPGTYTVVAGDEWGSVAFAYFVVVASS